MATKKTTSKPRATSATKKKAAPAKSRAPKTASTRTRAKKTSSARSFRIEKQTTPFMTTRTSRETLYWAVLGVVVILFTAWVMKLQSDIQAIYDSIDASNSAIVELPQNHKNGSKH